MLADVDLDHCIAVDAKVIAHDELIDETIIEGAHQSDAPFDDCGVQDLTAPLPALKVMIAFDLIRSFGAYDDDVAMQLLIECENRTITTHGEKKKELSDFFVNKWCLWNV